MFLWNVVYSIKSKSQNTPFLDLRGHGLLELADSVVQLQVVGEVVEPAVVGAGVLLEVHRLAVQRVEVLVVVHQVVPELVALRRLPADQRLLQVLDPGPELAARAALVVVAQVLLVGERVERDQGELAELLPPIRFLLLSRHFHTTILQFQAGFNHIQS